jgi:general stress protein 26
MSTYFIGGGWIVILTPIKNINMKENSSEIKNMTGQEAIDKYKEIVKHESVCHFATELSNIPATTRPMSVQKVCDQGNFWFLSSADSGQNEQIQEDSRVQLYFSNTSNYEFLTVYGNATVTRDPQKIDELWNDIAKAWFPEGKTDPKVTVIKVVPEAGFYWDTKDGKLMSMVKIVASAISGKTLTEGIEGKISVR